MSVFLFLCCVFFVVFRFLVVFSLFPDSGSYRVLMVLFKKKGKVLPTTNSRSRAAVLDFGAGDDCCLSDVVPGSGGGPAGSWVLVRGPAGPAEVRLVRLRSG